MVVYPKCASPQSSAVQHQPACASLGYGVSPGRDSCLNQLRNCKGKEHGARAHGSRDGSSLLGSSSLRTPPPEFPEFCLYRKKQAKFGGKHRSGRSQRTGRAERCRKVTERA